MRERHRHSRPPGAGGRVVHRHLGPDAIAATPADDINGYLHKSLRADELVEALERIFDGERLVLLPDADEPVSDQLTWPGRSDSLSEREAEVIALICQGLSNDEVARRAYPSINTIKGYVRTAYRKMGVSSRSQAVLRGLRHGMVHHTAVASDDSL